MKTGIRYFHKSNAKITVG